LDTIRRCVTELSRLPGIGERTATRLTYWLLRAPDDVVRGIAEAVGGLKQGVIECASCRNWVTASPCSICSDAGRDASLVCVVEHPQDIAAIERGGEWRGRYHVLHGSISPLDGVGPEKIRIAELLTRVERERIAEVVLATDPDVEGDTTALYIARLLQPLGIRVTRLAHGISVGTEIEYADRMSLARAMQYRREI
jgi:recombination protein RecR